MSGILYSGTNTIFGSKKTFIQIKPGDGWYANGVLVTSYVANGSSNIWTWNPPGSAIITLGGCGAGGGSGAGSTNGASAGAGGGGGAPSTSILGLVFPACANNTLKFTLGALGTAGVVGGSAATDGGDTVIEHSGISPYEYFFKYATGSLGAGAKFIISGGKKGVAASGGTKGAGGGSNEQQTGPVSGNLTLYSSQYGSLYYFYPTGAAGGDAGANGYYSYTSSPMTSFFGKAGGTAANSAGGGGAGSPSLFGVAGIGGNGQAQGAVGAGYGFGGAGGGGARANLSDAANGRDGGPGYIEMWVEWL